MVAREFVTAVPDDEVATFLRGIFLASKEARDALEELAADDEALHDYCCDALVVIEMMSRVGGLGLDLPSLSGEIKSDIDKVRALILDIEAAAQEGLSVHGTLDDKALIENYSTKTKAYRFKDDDFERVQLLLNELRNIVSRSYSVGDNHKHRLLMRLEKLQTELHKEISDFDRYWGLFGDVGPVVGKFGNDIKPFVDRVRELMDIVKRTQSTANESLEDQSQDASLDWDIDE